MKLITWFMLHGASVLAVVQVVLKFIKEVLTACVNILYPIIPSDKFKAIVEKVRGIVNMVDDLVEKGKKFLVK